MAESELLPTNYRSIRLTLPSPDIDLLVRPISLLRDIASTMEEIRKERTVEGETGIRDKGQDNGRDGRSKAQSFIYASDVLFTATERARKDIL
jgi:hypothetical protein